MKPTSDKSPAIAAGAAAHRSAAIAAMTNGFEICMVLLTMLEALAYAEAGMRSVRTLGKVDPDRMQPELRNVHAQPDAEVAAERPLSRIADDAAGERVDRRLRSANAKSAFVDEKGQSELAIRRERVAQLRLAQQRVRAVEDAVVAAQILIGERVQGAGRDHPGRDTPLSVQRERRRLEHRQELGDVQTGLRVPAVRTDRGIRDRLGQVYRLPAARIEDVVQRDRKS